MKIVRLVLHSIVLAFLAAGIAQSQIISQVVNSIVATTCSAQFVRAISATGAATCATVALATDVSGTLPATSLPTPKVITITRDLTVASGNVAYTGCGFSPRMLIATGGVTPATSQYITFTGFAASGGGAGSSIAFGTTYANSAAFLNVADTTAANSQNATVISYDADGFTLGWTKTGTPIGTATFYVACVSR